jgi:hypothetical protein
LEEHCTQNDVVCVQVGIFNVDLTESLTRGVVKGLSKSSEGNSKIVNLVCESDVEAIVPQIREGGTRLRSDA